MNDRDCDNCAHHSDGGCSVWECSFVQKDDTISRQAAVDAICGECQANCIPCESSPCGEIKAVQALPSAQPEKTQLSEEDTTSDCISRHAAIDVIMDYPHGDVWNVENMDNMVCGIKALPSAQTEIITCGDCRYKDDGIDEDGIPFLKCLHGRSYGGTRINDFCSWAERRTDD